MSEDAGRATGTAAGANGDSNTGPETSEVGTGAGVPHVQLQLPPTDENVRPSIDAQSVSLQRSVPPTAATSMLTIVPVEEENVEEQRVLGDEDGAVGETAASRNADAEDAPVTGAQLSSPLPPASPQVFLSFLLISGSRRGMSFDPSTTVGRVKELVWNAWPSDCPPNEEKPPAPNYLRILYLGKILQDEDTLTAIGFPISKPPTGEAAGAPTAPQPTIVHLSVRPYAPPSDDGDTLKKNLRAARRALSRSASHAASAPGADAAGAAGDGAHAGGCCGCVIC